MAENSSAKKLKSTLIYLDSTKIFKRRFLTLYNKSKEKGFNVVSEFSSNVGIIVTESSFVDDFVALRNIAADVSNLDFVKTQWLSNCLREGRILEIAEENRVPNKQPPAAPSCDPSGAFSEYECQRRTPLKHCNLIFTQALRILERDAVLKGDEQNNSRALAFRRGMCTIASLENPIKRWSDIKGLPHIGKHIELVVQDILETGHSEEAECIQSSVWFKVVDLFEGVFGVGPSTAQKWFNAGFRNICDVIQSSDVQNHRDERLLYGLAFHADLNIPVCKSEAVFWEDLVKKELAAIDPEATVTLTGGFSRGKEEGHDIDLLLSHPTQGQDADLLTRLLVTLEEKGLIVYGKHEQSTFAENISHKGAALKSSLDHFEKWLGIVKLPGKAPHQLNTTIEKSCKLKNLVELASKPDRTWVARRVDLILVPQHQMPFALLGWIGSRMFNRSIRRYADKVMNMKLTSHGLYDLNKKEALAALCEEDVFQHLKLDYIKPSDRNC